MKVAARIVLALFFATAGVNHFVHEAFYVRIVPPWLPNPALLVEISGVAEVLGAVGVVLPRTRRMAGVGLIALLILVFPANVQMAQHPELYRDMGNAMAFYVRLPLQIVLVAWVWWACLRA